MAPLFSLVLLLLFFLPSSIPQGDLPQFWSIDCGGSESFTDYKNVTWVTDVGFVNSGENRSVKVPTTNTPRELQTLRVFKSTGTLKEMKKKYCYTIPVPKGTKVLAMARFNYGNYDGRGIAPEFKVFYDGNYWVTSLKTSVDGPVWTEIIYVTKRNHTNICLARTSSDQDPFVSSIEVRTLKPEMYSDGVDSNKALFNMERFAYGANETIRYPDDIYDRVWDPSKPDGFTYLTNNAKVVNTTLSTETPPQLMLHSAIALPDNYSIITISFPRLPSSPVDVYYTMYFTEMTNLTAEMNAKRSFLFNVDGILKYKYEITPQYKKVFQLINGRSQASNNTKYELQRANNSTLPPIISGLEFFRIFDVNQYTFEDDVQALSLLQEHFKLLQGWTGDPCLPEEYNWEWVGCAHFTTPRIITLNLSGYGLSGSLPDFSGLNFLKNIDLSNNSFTGDIPEFLGKLPQLNYLNLANNDFGSIPTSLRNNTTIDLNITGNPKLKDSLSPPPAPTNGDNIKVEAPKFNVINTVVFFATVLIYHVYH